MKRKNRIAKKRGESKRRPHYKTPILWKGREGPHRKTQCRRSFETSGDSKKVGGNSGKTFLEEDRSLASRRTDTKGECPKKKEPGYIREINVRKGKKGQAVFFINTEDSISTEDFLSGEPVPEEKGVKKEMITVGAPNNGID